MRLDTNMGAHGCMGYACVCGSFFCNICSRYCGTCGRDTAAAFPSFEQKEGEQLRNENEKLRQTVRELTHRIVVLESQSIDEETHLSGRKS